MSTRAPTAECPCCGHEFHISDYFDYEEGSDVSCPKCGAELAVSEIEMVMHWSFTTMSKYEADQATLKANRDLLVQRGNRVEK